MSPRQELLAAFEKSLPGTKQAPQSETRRIAWSDRERAIYQIGRNAESFEAEMRLARAIVISGTLGFLAGVFLMMVR